MKKNNNNIVSVDENSCSVTITVDTRIYSKDVVNKALRAYSKFCTFKVDYANNNATVSLHPKTNELGAKEIGYEFCNYLLALLKSG